MCFLTQKNKKEVLLVADSESNKLYIIDTKTQAVIEKKILVGHEEP